MHIYIHIYIFVYICVYIYMYLYVCIYKYICIYEYIYTHIFIQKCTNIWTNKCIYIFVYTYRSLNISTHEYKGTIYILKFASILAYDFCIFPHILEFPTLERKKERFCSNDKFVTSRCQNRTVIVTAILISIFCYVQLSTNCKSHHADEQLRSDKNRFYCH